MSRARKFSQSSQYGVSYSSVHDAESGREKDALLEGDPLSSHSGKSLVKQVATTEELIRNRGTEKVPLFCSYRFNVIVCCMLSMMVNFASQASMASAFVCMLEDDDDDFDDTIDAFVLRNSTPVNLTKSDDDDWIFDWDKSTQGFVLSSLFLGYYVSQLPAGVLSARFGPRRVVIVGLVLEAVFQLLTVPAAQLGVGWLCADRFMAGLIDGLLYAPTFALVGQWTPRFETSILFGVAGIGMELGNMFSFTVATVACEIDLQGGWPIIFYVLGATSILTAVLFVFFVSDSPFNNKFISKNELNYMAAAIPKLENNDKSTLAKIPVKAILKSMPVWAIVVAQIGSDWLYYMLISVSPQYLKDVIKLSDLEVNLLSGLPFIAIIPSIYLAGSLGDKLVVKGIMSNTTVRKISDTICKLVPAATLLGLCFLPEGWTALAAVFNTLGAIALGFSYVSWMANPVDLAPAYTGFVVGVCELGAIWVAIVVPLLFDYITRNKERSEWQLAFYITVGLQVLTNLFYWVFASGELQPWSLSSYSHSYEPLENGDVTEPKKVNSLVRQVSLDRRGRQDVAASLSFPALERSTSRAADDRGFSRQTSVRGSKTPDIPEDGGALGETRALRNQNSIYEELLHASETHGYGSGENTHPKTP